MSTGVSEITWARPVTVRAQVISNCQRQTMALFDVDYRRVARQQGRPRSPLEPLFGGATGSLFDDFFGGDFFDRGPRVGRDAPHIGGVEEGTGGTPVPARSGRSASRGRPAGGIAERLSAHAEEILQAAARRAHALNRREGDSEHLLCALTDSDVVRTIFDQFKLAVDDLRRQLDREGKNTGGDAEAERSDKDEATVGVAP